MKTAASPLVLSSSPYFKQLYKEKQPPSNLGDNIQFQFTFHPNLSTFQEPCRVQALKHTLDKPTAVLSSQLDLYTFHKCVINNPITKTNNIIIST